MSRLTYITPINRKVTNLNILDCVVIYLSKDNKLKKAIPDFNQMVIDGDDSKIEEALGAEKLALFKKLKTNEQVSTPVFSIYSDESGEIVRYTTSENTDLKLENLLLGPEQRQRVLKMLKR